MDPTVKRRDVSSRGWSPTLLPTPAAPPHSPFSTISRPFDLPVGHDIEQGTEYREEYLEESTCFAPRISVEGQDAYRPEGTTKDFQSIVQGTSSGINGSKSFSIAYQRIPMMQKPERRLSCPSKEVEGEQTKACESVSNMDLDTMRGLQSAAPTKASEWNAERLPTCQNSQDSSPRSATTPVLQGDRRTLSLPVRRRPPGSPMHAKQPRTPNSGAHNAQEFVHESPQGTQVSALPSPSEEEDFQSRLGSSQCPTSPQQLENTKIEAAADKKLREDPEGFMDEFINRNPVFCVDFNRDVMIQECLGSGSAGVVYKALWRGDTVSALFLWSLEPESISTSHIQYTTTVKQRAKNCTAILRRWQ